jgi:D-glycero-alpha-D-manno-heptose-7-phosphate kinase
MSPVRPSSNDDGRRGIVAQAPCRADLAGSTLDLWPLYLFHPGAVTLNFAVSILTTCRITPLPGRTVRLRSLDTNRQEAFASFEDLCRADRHQHALAARLVQFFRPQGGFELETHSESPAGAGIAGSSALMIATTTALARFTGRKLEREEIRVIAQNIEAQIINVPTGCQDYYPALYGGVSAVHLDVDGIHREPLPIAPEEIEARFLLVYTGAPRQSGINNWEVFKAHIDGDPKVVRNFEQISQISRAMHAAVLRRDWNSVGALLREEWKLRRANYKGISTPLIDRLVAAARRNGGVAAKVCGAGGGGCVVFMVREEAKARVARALQAAGGQVLPFRVMREGVMVSPLSRSNAGSEKAGLAKRKGVGAGA